MARIVVNSSEIGVAVIVAGPHVIHLVGTRSATDITDALVTF